LAKRPEGKTDMAKVSSKPSKAFRINDTAPDQKDHVDLNDDGSEKKVTSSF
jgi:hypothetical protein